MNIFKFIDETDGNAAFVMHNDLELAKEMLKEKTSLKFQLDKYVNSEEFPDCIEKLDNKPGIWINNILPF